MPKIPKELERTILALTTKEKDKMLLKLIAKNELLIQQLDFQLLCDESDLKEKRQEVKESIVRSSKGYHDTPGWLMMDMRDLNGRITHHVKVTKDKYGEVELTLLLLVSFFDNQKKHFEKYNSKSDTLANYVAKRTEFLMKKLPKLDPDYYIEFEDDVQRLLTMVHTLCPSVYAKDLGIAQIWNY
jgi:hypothetical protein